MTDLKDKLAAIHKQVFDLFTYAEDIVQYGMEEKWVMPERDYDGSEPILGDCEDFALACRALCRLAGVDNSRLIYCVTETDEGHCVLEVEGWILDNRQEKLTSRDSVRAFGGYEWVAASGYNSGEPWRLITNG